MTFAVFHAPALHLGPGATALGQGPSGLADHHGGSKRRRVVGAERRSDCLFIIHPPLVTQSQGEVAQ